MTARRSTALLVRELQIEDLHFDAAPTVEIVADRLEGDAATAVLLEVLHRAA